MIKIGTLLWKPIHRYQPTGEWTSHRITGETTRSWIVDGEREKVSKETLQTRADAGGIRGQYYSKIEMGHHIWVMTHRRGIGDMVQRCGDIRRLQNIAREIGYDDGSKP